MLQGRTIIFRWGNSLAKLREVIVPDKIMATILLSIV
jgi:antitoxin component of MazEF toxin-antitoxin module